MRKRYAGVFKMAKKKLPKPETVRFQTSQRGIIYPSLKAAREDFEEWLETGVAPSGAQVRVHIWQNKKERVLDKIENDHRGKILRAVIRRALRSGKLYIRKIGKNRR